MKKASQRDINNAEMDAVVFMALSDKSEGHLKEASDIVNWIKRKAGYTKLYVNYRAVLRSLERLLKKRFIRAYGRGQQCANLWYSRERIV